MRSTFSNCGAMEREGEKGSACHFFLPIRQSWFLILARRIGCKWLRSTFFESPWSGHAMLDDADQVVMNPLMWSPWC